MVKFRRSTKSSDGGKHDSIKATFASIPQKDAIAIVPPKKVIKALYDYNAPEDPPHYLSFSAGDFLHVVGRENDPDWYEACNPLHGSRGLVPVKYFDTVGKTVRDSRGSTTSGSSAPHDSGFADNTTPRGNGMPGNGMPGNGMPGNGMPANGILGNGMPGNGMVGPGPGAGHRSSRSIGRLGGGGAMVYGIVAYDFHAERPDELEAREGEAIIVIAQSNPEWFVAKPITRLGGPGLIPVSFIEIKDMHTGQTVTDSAEAVARAGIPRVEEWKKMAADYKNTSIPLGQFGSSGHTSSTSMGNMQQGMERMSMGQQSNGMGHSRTPSNQNYQQHQHQRQQSQQRSYNAQAPIRAAVPRFVYADEKFHFVVECTLANGSHWDLSRIYEDFYELQINLLKEFPVEAGENGQPRTLPYMPGPVQFVSDKISEGRREHLDEYLRNLLGLGPHITGSSLIQGFFSPRGGDYEVDPSQVENGSEHSRSLSSAQNRYSQSSQMSQNPYQQGYNGAGRAGPPSGSSSQHQREASSGSTFPHQKSSQSLTSNTYAPNRGPPGGGHARTPSDFAGGLGPSQSNTLLPPPNSRTITQGTASSVNTTSSSTQALKVKVWFDRETCVVVRMPPKGQFRYADLYRKIVERRKLEFVKSKDPTYDDDEDIDPALEIEYRDEKDGEYYRLADNAELEQAVSNNEKLTLVVRAMGDEEVGL